MHAIIDFLNNLIGIFTTMKFPVDYIDIILVAILLYYVIKFTKDTRTGYLIQGLLLILVLFQVAKLIKLSALVYILDNTIQLSFIAVIILFQPELRSAFERLGRVNFMSFKNIPSLSKGGYNRQTEEMIEAVCESCKIMSERKIGALIVFEVLSKFTEIADTGVTIDSVVTPQTMITVFFPNTPLHDGAVIIRENRIAAAGCILPLSKNLELDKEFGTRHRAAIGMTEGTDALCVVVSEQTGKISYVMDGQIHIGINETQLKKILEDTFIIHEKKRRFFGNSNSEVKKDEY